MDCYDLGKHFLYPLHSPELSQVDKELIQRIKPAGVFLDGRSFAKELPYPEWHRKFSELLREALALVNRPKAIVAIDHEGGRVVRVPEPFTRSPFAGAFLGYADEVARIHAAELAALGVNVAFGPVADINSNPANPVIGPRAFGATSAEVCEGLRRFCPEFLKSGIKCVLKHFPGHGDTEEDSHLTFPKLDLPEQLILERELAPYKLLSELAIPAVMSAHVCYPALDPKYPATLSKRIIQGILREQLHFNGLVVSDDLDMRAIHENFSDEEVAVLCLEAGVDLMLVNHRPEKIVVMLEALSIALTEKRISEIQLRASDRRLESFLKSLPMPMPNTKPVSFFQKHKELLTKLQIKAQSQDLNFLGIEPRPRQARPPKEVPLVRVGLILEEDNKQELTFTADQDLIGVDRRDYKIQLEANKSYVISVSKNQLALKLPDGKVIDDLDTIFTVEQPNSKLTPGTGLTLDGVVAGRHFHWRKEISEVFPGKLEIHPEYDRLVVVNVLDFESYTICVVGSEMSGKGLPKEFAKAQALAARSWTYVFMGNKYPGKPYTVCNDDMSQRYQGTTHIDQELIETLSECSGEYIVDQYGFVSPCYYSKSTGGHSELSEHAFGFPAGGISAQFDCPKEHEPALDLRKDADFDKWLSSDFLKGRKIYCSPEVVSEGELKKFLGAVDAPGKYFRWEHETKSETILKNLREKFKLDAEKLVSLTPGARGVSGRYLSFNVGYLDSKSKPNEFTLPSQFSIRAAFHESFLFSSAFVHTTVADSAGHVSSVRFRGAGWGHGVGFCQIGALGMSLLGKSYKEILKHYFGGAELRKVY